jgi:hypothetical protein
MKNRMKTRPVQQVPQYDLELARRRACAGTKFQDRNDDLPARRGTLLDRVIAGLRVDTFGEGSGGVHFGLPC